MTERNICSLHSFLVSKHLVFSIQHSVFGIHNNKKGAQLDQNILQFEHAPLLVAKRLSDAGILQATLKVKRKREKTVKKGDGYDHS